MPRKRIEKIVKKAEEETLDVLKIENMKQVGLPLLADAALGYAKGGDEGNTGIKYDRL